MKVQFTWERVLVAVLGGDWDFGDMASDPLDASAEAILWMPKAEEENRETNFHKTNFFFALHAIIVLE